MEPLISVIVPVYNVEYYLDRCLTSLVNQTYSNMEIILIDDGSKDNSGMICDNWKEKDNRIVVIHKKNAGLGYARNSGLEICKGEYICFVDSDDFVSANMIQTMYDAIKKENADTCYCSFNIYSNKKNEVVKKSFVNSGVYDGKKILLDIAGSLPEDKVDFNKEMSVWACLFSGQIIRENGIVFTSEREIICEDFPFDIRYLPKTNKVVVIDNCFYYYCINGESLTHKFDEKRFDKEKHLFSSLDERLSSVISKEDYLIRLQRLFLGRIRATLMIEIKNSKLGFFKIIKDVKKIISDELVQEVLQDYPYQKNPRTIKLFNACMKNKLSLAVYIMCLIR